MREQLYKAKRVDNGEWVEGDLHRVFTDNVGKKGNLTWAIRILETYEDGSQGLRSIKVIPETVGQFTGLTDKNGTKIFEGDLVRANIPEININSIRYVVLFFEGGFCVQPHHITSIPPIYISDVEDIHVIGNIHE